MKINKTIETRLNTGQIKTIVFGQPETSQELEEMYRFRNSVYEKRGYIKRGYYENGLDYDDLDEDGKCVYFVAYVDGRLIGSLRLIVEEYLPTERECFDFEEPLRMKSVPRNQRGEIGRLIVERFENDVFFPRHVILLGMLDDTIRYCEKNSILGGYAFIKDKLKKKLEKLRIPIHIITTFKKKYQNGVLQEYFNNPKDPVWPIYYIVGDLRWYFDLIFKMFKKSKENANHYVHRNNVFVDMFIKIIVFIKTRAKT